LSDAQALRRAREAEFFRDSQKAMQIAQFHGYPPRILINKTV
jgi:hypothetical protein